MLRHKQTAVTFGEPPSQWAERRGCKGSSVAIANTTCPEQLVDTYGHGSYLRWRPFRFSARERYIVLLMAFTSTEKREMPLKILTWRSRIPNNRRIMSAERSPSSNPGGATDSDSETATPTSSTQIQRARIATSSSPRRPRNNPGTLPSATAKFQQIVRFPLHSRPQPDRSIHCQCA